MRHPRVTVGVLIQLALVAAGAGAQSAVAKPVSGPRETVDSRLTTTRPNAPTGFVYTGSYHAAGDPKGSPPYMRRMRSYSPGLRYDTSVPERCAATDFQLELLGAKACPAGSRVGGGTTQGSFMGRPTTLPIDVFNNTAQQIFLVRTPGLNTVARGRIYSDGSAEFASPTCYPSVEPPGCPVDNALQLGSHVTVAPYTRRIYGKVRSYLTTPAKCPAVGYWKTPVRFWWADGAVDTVVTRQPCTRPRP